MDAENNTVDEKFVTFASPAETTSQLETIIYASAIVSGKLQSPETARLSNRIYLLERMMKRQSKPTIAPVEFIDKVIRCDEKAICPPCSASLTRVFTSHEATSSSTKVTKGFYSALLLFLVLVVQLALFIDHVFFGWPK